MGFGGEDTQSIDSRSKSGHGEQIAHLELLSVTLGVNCMDALVDLEAFPMYRDITLTGATVAETLKEHRARWEVGTHSFYY